MHDYIYIVESSTVDLYIDVHQKEVIMHDDVMHHYNENPAILHASRMWFYK